MSLEDDYEAIDLKGVRQMIANRQEEHLGIDFKTVKHATLNSEDDKRSLSTALSGFANSSGGLVVWGVTTSKKDGVDSADGEKLIAPLGAFVARLNSLTGEAATPILDGVRHKSIPVNGDEGFAVTMVPESLGGPHMAKLGEHRYYKRSGDSFYRMEHYDIADMFGRRRKPLLHVWHEHGWRNNIAAIGHEEFVVSVVNTGRASAQHLGMMLVFGPHLGIVGTEGEVSDISTVNEGRPNASYEMRQGVLHPNGIYHRLGKVFLTRTPKHKPSFVTLLTYCDGVEVIKEVIQLPPLDAGPLEEEGEDD